MRSIPTLMDGASTTTAAPQMPSKLYVSPPVMPDSRCTPGAIVGSPILRLPLMAEDARVSARNLPTALSLLLLS